MKQIYLKGNANNPATVKIVVTDKQLTGLQEIKNVGGDNHFQISIVKNVAPTYRQPKDKRLLDTFLMGIFKENTPIMRALFQIH